MKPILKKALGLGLGLVMAYAAIADTLPSFKDGDYARKAKRKEVPEFVLYLKDQGFRATGSRLLEGPLQRRYTREVTDGDRQRLQTLVQVPETDYYVMVTTNTSNQGATYGHHLAIKLADRKDELSDIDVISKNKIISMKELSDYLHE